MSSFKFLESSKKGGEIYELSESKLVNNFSLHSG